MHSKSRRIPISLPLCALGLALLSACNTGPDRQPDTSYNPLIPPDSFSATIDNRYYTLKPGSIRTFAGTEDGVRDSIVVEVLAETRKVMGVDCRVVRDRAFEAGALVEDTYDWFAQHRDGTVWYFGEDTKEIEDGEVVDTEGSWEAGVAGAKPGIVMLGSPAAGPVYRQEYFFDEAEDYGQVVGTVDSLTIGLGTFREVLLTKEWTPLEPGILEHKYYAPGVGLIKEEKVQGGSGSVELVASQP